MAKISMKNSIAYLQKSSEVILIITDGPLWMNHVSSDSNIFKGLCEPVSLYSWFIWHENVIDQHLQMSSRYRWAVSYNSLTPFLPQPWEKQSRKLIIMFGIMLLPTSLVLRPSSFSLPLHCNLQDYNPPKITSIKFIFINTINNLICCVY